MQSMVIAPTSATAPSTSRLRPLQPVNPHTSLLPRGAAMSRATSTLGSQVVPVEPYLRWDADVSRRFLSSVDRVEIHESLERSSTRFFVVDVFLTTPESRLPVPNSSIAASPTRSSKPSSSAAASPSTTDSTVDESAAPTYQIERRYSAFGSLRDTIESWLHESVPLCRCAYCVGFIEYLRFSLAQPGMLNKLLYRGEARKEMLAGFLNDLIKLARREPTSEESWSTSHITSVGGRRRTSIGDWRANCKVRAHVPSLLESFLLDKSHQ